MALPRSKYVEEGKVGTYHCTSRCVRRAFLCGFDAQTGRDFSHRKEWVEDRLKQLTSIFAAEVSSFSVMDNHYHVIVRIRPDIAEGWSDIEVASRWLTLCPVRYKSKKAVKEPAQKQILNLILCPDRIAELRKRLSSLSWFMKHLNEYIARAANKEDEVKGRFWESRFKCQVLLDDAATAGCMVYVDLNPIRAGIAATPEESDFTSIRERIRIWCKGTNAAKHDSAMSEQSSRSESWLCPISSQSGTGGILAMTTEEYFELVDRSGRMIRSDKRGAIDPDIEPILQRIGARPEAWVDTILHFGDKFHLVAGLLKNMRNFADKVGTQWFAGFSAAYSSFTSS